MSNSHLLWSNFKIFGTFQEAKKFFPHCHFSWSLFYYYSIVTNISKKYILIKTQIFTPFFFLGCVLFCHFSGQIWNLVSKTKQTPWMYMFPPLIVSREVLIWSAGRFALKWEYPHSECPFSCQSQIANLLILKNTVTLFFIITCWSARRHNEYALTCGLTLACILDPGRYKFFARFYCFLATSPLSQRRWT